MKTNKKKIEGSFGEASVTNSKILSQYNIRYVMKQGISQKIPNIVLLLKEVKFTVSDASVKFIDPSGFLFFLFFFFF